MRQIGTLPDGRQAQRFIDYLVSRGITASALEEDGDWCIWVSDEDHLETARSDLAEFTDNPADPKYAAAASKAAQIRKDQQAHRAARSRRLVDVRRDIWGQPAAKRMPLTMVLLGISVVVALWSGLGARQQDTPLRELSFCDPTHRKEADFLADPDGLVDVKAGEIWRAITPIFIHFGVIHLAFNMLMLYPLAGQIEIRRGTPLLGLLVLAIGLFSNLGQYLVAQSPWFGGMSGVLYGMFGFIWVRMVRHPNEGLRVHQQTIVILMIWLVLGFTGAIGNMANYAHLFGLLAGAGIAAVLPAKTRKRQPG
jgi:GlpG protein